MEKKFKFNMADVIIIIAVIVIVAGVGYKLFAPKAQEFVAPTKQVEVTFRIRGAMTYMIDELNARPEILQNQPLVAGAGYVSDAKVTSFEMVPYQVQLSTDDGHIVSAIDPDRVDILVKVEATVKDSPIIKIANQEVRVGRTFILKTQRFETTPTIDTIVFK